MTYLQSIDDALARGQIEQAALIAESALVSGATEAICFNLAAWLVSERGRPEESLELLHKAISLYPEDALLRIGLGSALRKSGQIEQALFELDTAARVVPENPAVWLERGYALEDVGLLGHAAESYERAVTLDPGMVPARAGVASMRARLGQTELAERLAADVLAIEPHNIVALCARARCLIERGQAEAAEQLLAPHEARQDVGVQDRIILLGLLGDACDRQGKADAAYARYSGAKRLFAPRGTTERSSQRAFVEAIAADVASTSRADWSIRSFGPCPEAARSHVFLLGYPRSGTTLVETVLATLPGTETAEEQPTLHDADRALLSEPVDLGALLRLDADEARRLNQAYWNRVAGLGLDVRGKMFVDMDPLKGIKLPVIATLFPDARVIVMRRDPRDVVWSCFHTNFAPSAAAFEFTTLESTARHYHALMSLTELCLQLLPVQAIELRYEDLVRDFDTTTARMCAFLGQAWSPDLREFNRATDSRPVATASASQVRRKLYDGSGQWRPYARQMDPILPILEPWVKKFGYAP